MVEIKTPDEVLEGFNTMVTAIARAAHEANRAYCISIGDDSQVSWDDAPEWQQASSRNGVHLLLANPDTTSEELHESWVREKVADGWVPGDVKDAEAKTHPCLVPYSQLSLEQRIKDSLYGAVCKSMILCYYINGWLAKKNDGSYVCVYYKEPSHV